MPVKHRVLMRVTVFVHMADAFNMLLNSTHILMIATVMTPVLAGKSASKITRVHYSSVLNAAHV